MAQREFILRPQIEQRHQIVAQSRNQIIARDRLQRITGLKVIGHHAADLCNVPFADAAQGFDQGDHFGIAGQAIENVLAATLSLHETRTPEDLQVARGVGERQMRPGRQLLDSAYPLRQVLQQFQPVSVAKRLRHGKATGAVVDPVGDIQPYLQAADNAGMQIHFVIDTHVHADHLSAGRALAAAAGAEYVLSADAAVSFPYKAVRDGDVLPLGNVSATVLHTPGHAPEHICILVTDRPTSRGSC
jgi:hypothetical protein